MIGLERGWRERERAEGSRVAGLRTFALFGLLGGVLGVLSETLAPWPSSP
ncbi:MgtC/SapB family protein [Polaromonas sp.]